MNKINIELNEQIELLKNILQAQKNNRKKYCSKYQKSEKGKVAQKKANAKYRKPTGNPRGRPRKEIITK